MGTIVKPEKRPSLRTHFSVLGAIDPPMGNRIAELRKLRGLSQTELAKLVDTKKTQIGKLERSERRLSDHWAQRIAPHLGVQPFELFMAEGEREIVRFVPLIHLKSCGNWREAIKKADSHVPTVARGKDVFALKADGDCMDQIATKDGYVYVDPDDRDLIEGKIYVVMNGVGEPSAKVYHNDPSRLEPCSTNPEYEKIMVGAHPFTVIGRVVGAFSPL